MRRRTAFLLPALLLLLSAPAHPAAPTPWSEARSVVEAVSALLDDAPSTLARRASRAGSECLRLADAAAGEDADTWFDRAARLAKRLERLTRRAARTGEEEYAAEIAGYGRELYLATRRLLLDGCARIRERSDFLDREDLVAVVAGGEQAVDRAERLRARGRPLSRALRVLRKGYRKSLRRA